MWGVRRSGRRQIERHGHPWGWGCVSEGVRADGRRNTQIFWGGIECRCRKVSHFCVGRMLCQILGGFFCGGVGKYFCILERAVRASPPRWRFIFVLRESAMFFAEATMASAAVTVGLKYICALKIPCLISLSLLSFAPTGARNDNTCQRCQSPPLWRSSHPRCFFFWDSCE